jgi:hypothetical protein
VWMPLFFPILIEGEIHPNNGDMDAGSLEG